LQCGGSNGCPRFFFDVFDGERLWTDTEGTEHSDLAAAHDEAVETITSMGSERFLLSGPGLLSVEIRPEGQPAVEKVTVTLSVQKL
jgi:hypothetical protein